ncbi:MAG: filamentous hemagglutinin N-terminal domain-containing protein [Pseudomonadota bacterium]
MTVSAAVFAAVSAPHARRLRSARDQLFVRCPRRIRRALGWHRQRSHGVAFSALALLAASALAPATALANPSGAQVVAGQVRLESSVPATLNIHQGSDKAIIHWQRFDIAAGETVNFIQPSVRSVSLNRVLGRDPSAIFGRLTANGTVMLVNPNGVVFGPSARIDVGGLVATTANLRDDDFLAGRLHFGEASPNAQARIVNAGEISIRDSGLAALVAPRVQNSGVVQARLGQVVLGGAQRFTLDFQGDGMLSFAAPPALQAQVLNTGTLQADGGTVLLGASAVKGVVDQVINTSGLVVADSVSGTPGRIVLSGGESGSVAVSGTLQASGAQGGTVLVNGQQVQVDGSARIDVSGRHGGGEIALGSDGLASGYARLSEQTTVAAGARLQADALQRGDGGHVTLWSSARTRFGGSISARGGVQGGDGGFAEVSSQRDIALTGTADLRAPQGRTGQLLLDPTDLRITDAASGGSQDGNATDASVAAGDANQGAGGTLNTVSRGLLESLSGTANISLQATGQITVDAMAGGLIDLATTAGHGFSLQSTQSGGIRFADAATEIRTQGGHITLQANGIGSALSNIGKLSSNGGAITLQATGDITLAGALNAGSGALRLQSTVGSIANAAASTPLLSGGTVSLSAPGGHIGAAGQAIHTHTSNLALASGGHLVAASDTALANLVINAGHVAPTDANTYQVSAPGLGFQLSDGASLVATQIDQASGLNLSLSTDRSLQLGTVDVGAGTLTLGSTGGNLLGAADTALSAASLVLSAAGSNGNNGAIGSGGQALLTSTGQLQATAGSGGVFLANASALALNRLSTTGSSGISAAGTLTAGDVSAGSATLALASNGGSVLDDGDAGTRISAGTLNLTAAGAIGSSGTRLSTNASTLSANAGSGGIHAGTTATSSVLSSIVSGDGAIDIRTGGSTTLTALSSTTSSATNSITVTATGTGSFSVGSVNAGALGDVSLATSSGSISGNSGLITGETVTLHAANSGSVSVRTAASHLDVRAGSSSISITQTGAVTLDRISTPSTVVSVTSSSGDITVGTVSTAASGQVSLTASAGAIHDDGDTSTRIRTGTATLNASGAIGAAGQAVQTQATGLAATSTGDLHVSNTDATLTSLSITNRHATAGVANLLQVTSPYLTFDVTDSGTQYSLNRLVGVPLNALAFSGDQTLQIGQVQAGGSVSLSATNGHLVDDGNLNSRVTSGSTLSLSATQGSVGSSSAAIGANAGSLALTTRGDLYVSNLADLGTLTINSSHADTTTSHGMAITAPSLKLSVSDSAAGHAVHTLTDNSSLSLTFTSDRDITLGQVDLSHTGTARFTSSAGNILDDGNKTSRVLANSATLVGRAVGASGNAHLDVVTGTLAATASAGGVYVDVPMPTGSTNTTSTLTLGTITATGPVAITAREGDLSLGGFMTASNQAVSLTASQGSILSPSGYSIAIGTGSLTLDAAQAIGSSSRPVPISSSTGATLTAQAGAALFASGSGALVLSSLDAGTSISYTQSSGNITVGQVDATAGGTVAITATTGSILNDGDAATGIRANQVALSAAQGSIGSGTAIAVSTPQLQLTANGQVAVADSATLDSLSITRGSGSSGSLAVTAGAGQTFSLSEDGSSHHLETVDSNTALAFSFAGQRSVRIGQIDVGSTGSASISSASSLANDGTPGAGIAAGTVALTSGTTSSIGAVGDAISLAGSTRLTLSTGRNAHVTSDTALSDLAITSTNATTVAGTASQFGLSGLGQSFGITDSGTTQTLDFSGTALTHASFSTRKNIAVGAITAIGDVALSTAGGGANSNISSDNGSGRIAGNRVLLTATSSTAGGGSIGSSGTALRVDAPTVILAGSGNVYLDDAQNLARLDMTLTHGTNTTFGYGVSAGNLNSFTVTDGSTQSLGLAVSGAMDFSYSVDRALSLATIDAGTSTTGSIALTSRSAPTGTGAQINRSSGSLTGGRITLSAVGSNGGVGAGATLSTNTKNLAIAAGGNVSVSNSTTLESLNLDARHNTSGSSTHSYSISSTGLTFSISDTLGSNAFQLSNISQSGLDLSLKADRVLTASSVNTGAGGKVTLHSSSYVQGGSGASAGSPSITTGDLTLNGGSAFGYQGGTPLYTAASTLGSTLSNTLYLSNAGALSLLANSAGSSADVASSSNSLLQGSGGLFSTPTLKLSANQSLGSNNTLQTDARRLTLVARNNIDVANASDLYALTMTSTHGTPGVQNSVSVAAPRLALALTDSVGGNQYHLANLVDSSGLDFTLSTDVDLNLGTVNAQAGRALALYSTGSTTSISNDGSSLLSAGSITLSAGGSVGAAGGSGTRLQTDALSLSLATGANAFADNAQDLSSLSLTSSQAAGGTAPVYQVTAPQLSFDISDNGSTRINQLADSTGLNFVLNTRRDQAVNTIDLGRSGTVSLTSTGDILGDADSSHRIHAASASFYASNGGAIGSVGNPIHLSAPLTSFAPTGALNVESDTHIHRLSISTTHPTVTYGGTYSIVSTPISGAAYLLFSATDSVTGTALTSLDDPLGLAFSFTSDRAMQLGTLNLGSTGTVALTGTGSGDILGDGDANTLVQAASLSMTSYGGAVGASGSGNGIDATVNSVSATAQGGGVHLSLHGRTLLGSISATGGVALNNDEGDIALGSINAGGQAVNINNQGGSILSGSLFNTTTVALTASGSIGNTSAIGTSANGGGTTTLTASASAAHGAVGSIAISESYNLAASVVTAPAGVTLNSGYNLMAGTVTSGGAVALESYQGSISGIDGNNAITGSSVSLSARYGAGNSIGSVGTRLNLNTPQLVLNTPGSVYVTDSADLNLLTLDRTNYTGASSGGTLSVIANGLSFSASDSADTTSLSSLADNTGLDFSYLGIGSLAVGNLNVGTGSLLLQAYLSSGDGNINAINNNALITAGSLTLQAYGTDSNIGSSGTALGLAVGSLTASAGSGGMVLRQAGALNLSSLATTGDLAVTTSSGDLTLGTLSYGSARTLNLTASGGSILAGGGTLAGSGANAAITLSAANGIGTAAAPILVNASAGHTLNASVTGSGGLHLSSLGTLNGGLNSAVHDGATHITAAGNIKLTDLRSGTDAAGNDIRVSASAGDISMLSVSGGSGAAFNAIDLSANAGRLLALPGATLEAFDVQLHGATGVGSSSNRVAANGQRVQVSSSGGAIYLTASTPSVLSSVASAGGAIDISHSADLLLAHAASSGGAISVSSSTANTSLFAGNLDAGSGALTLSASGAGSRLQDDGNHGTRVTGGVVNLSGTAGVGSSTTSLQTSAATLTASSGNGIFIDDARSAGTTLASVVASGGAVSVRSAGPTLASLVRASADSAGNTVTLATSSGDLTLVSVTAGANHGAVSLSSAGSILAGGNGTQVSGHSATLAAAEDIGAVSNLTTGAGTPITLDVTSIAALGTSGSNRVVSVHNIGNTALTLGGGALSLGSSSSAYLSTAGDLDLSAGISLANGNLALTAGGTLLLPTSAISTTGAVRLSGGTDILTSGNGAAARTLQVNAGSLVLDSGAAGGDTWLTTAVVSLSATLAAAGDLHVANTGTLSSTSLATSDGDISATSSTGMTAGSVVAGGSGRAIGLTATAGNLVVGTVNAGNNGSITLAATQGALSGASASLTASTLDLSSGNGIGSSGAAFGVHAANVSAQVTGTGGIHLASGNALTLGNLSTHDGDIAITAAGHLSAGAISAGQSGNVSLVSTGGNVTLTQAYTQAGSDASRAGLHLQGQAISVGAVSTTGAQTYTGALGIGGDLSAASITVTGDASLSGGARTLAGSLHISGSLAGGGHAATLNAGSGTVVLDGAASGLAALAVTGASIQLADVTTTGGAQTYQGATRLNGSYATQGGAFSVAGAALLDGATSVATSGGQASFSGTLDGSASLALDTGAGHASFGAVGQTTRLGSLVVHSAGTTGFDGALSAASLLTDAAGSLRIAGGSLHTTGSQHYGERAVLASHTTLTGSSITLGAGADAGTAGGQALVVVGDAVVNGPVGAQVALAGLSVSGSSTLGGWVVRTTGDQLYSGAVALAGDLALTSNGGTVTLAGTVDGAHALGLDTGSGDARFGGVVGGSTRLGAITVSAGGATQFGAAVSATSLHSDAAGTLAIDGGSVHTTGNQYHGERAVLGAHTILSGSSITLAQGADATSAGQQALVLNGNALLQGAIGAQAALQSLTSHGDTQLSGGSVATTGAQTWNGALSIGSSTQLTGQGLHFGAAVDSAAGSTAALAINAGSGDVRFSSSIGQTRALGALSITSAGATRFDGAVAAASVATDAAGSLALHGGSVATSGNQSWGERLILGADTTLSGSSITLAQGADGSTAGQQALSLQGNSQLHGATGAQAALKALQIHGNTVLHSASVATTGTQAYQGALSLAGDSQLSGAGISLGGVVDSAAGSTAALAIDAGNGDVRFMAGIGQTRALGALSITSAGATRFDGAVAAASVATDAAGSLALHGGSVATSGAQSWGERLVLTTDTTLSGSSITLAQGADATSAGQQALVLNGNALLQGAIGAQAALKALQVHGDTRFNGGSVATTGAQTWSQHLVLGSDTTLSGSSITLAQGADAASAGQQALVLSGNALLQGAIGAQAALKALTSHGDSHLSGGSVATTGAQTWNGALSIGSATQLTGQGLHFGAAVDSAAGSTAALAINAGSGDVRFSSTIGQTRALGALVITSAGATRFDGAVAAASVTTDAAGSLALHGGSVATGGNQSWGERLILGADTTLSGSSITLAQGADAASAGQQALVLSGNALLQGAIGAQAALKALQVHGDTRFNGGSVATTGAQTWSQHLVLGSDTTLSGSSVTLAQGADAASAGQQALVLNGNALLQGAIGAQAALQSLTSHGSTVFTGGSVATTGAQTWNGALSIGSDTQLTGQGLHFGATVDSAAGSTAALAIDGGSGDVRFSSTIGQTRALGALSITSTGATRFDGAVAAASVATDAAGSLALHGGSVATSGAQSWGERLVLTTDTTLSGSSITLAQGADGSAAGQQALSLQGNSQLHGAIGAQAALKALQIQGNTVLHGASVATTGTQVYQGALSLAGDSQLRGAGISLGGVVDSATGSTAALAIDGGSGDVRFMAGIGQTQALGALSITSAGATRFDGAVAAASVSTDAAGSLALHGGSVATSGNQSWGERLVLGADTTLSGSSITLAQGADAASAGQQALLLNGNSQLHGATGAQAALKALQTQGDTVLHGASVATTGTQVYQGALSLAGDSQLRGAGISLGGVVDSAAGNTAALAIDGGNGDVRFMAGIGQTRALGALVINSAGATRFDGAVAAASVATDAAGSLALHGGSVATSGNQSWGERLVLGVDTTLSGSSITLGQGGDATSAGGQRLSIQGDAVLNGPLGATQALQQLVVSGSSSLAAGQVHTTGDQRFGGAVQLVGDQRLHSQAGDLVLASTVDSSGRASLTLDSDAGAVAVAGAVGSNAALGALTVHAGSGVDFSGSIRAYRLQQTVGGLAHHLGTVWVDGPEGIELRAGSVRFDQAVSAGAGALQVALSDAAGVLQFAPSAHLATATGFTQTGGAAVVLPADVQVVQGPISLAAPASLPTGSARMLTQGDISLAGLSGPATALTLASGHGLGGSEGAGRLAIGSPQGSAGQRLDVASLSVPDAASAVLHGRIGGQGGAFAASRIGGPLRAAPYYMNDTPWGPLDSLVRLVASTTPLSVVPSTPRLTPLFERQITPGTLAPGVLQAFGTPQWLQISGAGVLLSGDNVNTGGTP